MTSFVKGENNKKLARFSNSRSTEKNSQLWIADGICSPQRIWDGTKFMQIYFVDRDRTRIDGLYNRHSNTLFQNSAILTSHGKEGAFSYWSTSCLDLQTARNRAWTAKQSLLMMSLNKSSSSWGQNDHITLISAPKSCSFLVLPRLLLTELSVNWELVI